MNGFKPLFVFVLLVFFSGNSKCLVKGNKTIQACTSKPLEIKYKYNENATWIYLKVKNVMLQGLDVNTTEFTCNHHHTFAKHCLEEMNNSTRIGNTVSFRIDKPWLMLNQSIVQCFTRISNSNPNRPSGARTIDLRSCQDPKNYESTSAGPTVTTTAAGQPNVSCSDVAIKASSDKFSIGTVVGAFFGGVGLVLAVIVARCCYKKFCQQTPDAVPKDEATNGNLPMFPRPEAEEEYH